MIKINLLPAYINQRKRMKVAIAVVTLLVAAEVAGFLIYRQGPEQQQAELTAKQQQVDNELNSLKQVGTQASAVNAEEATFKPKFQFIDNLETYNKRLPDMYSTTAAYTYREATLLSMTANGPQMAMNAYISKPDDIARLLLGLSRNPEFSGLPTGAGNPGYDPAQELLANQRRDPNAASTILGGTLMPGMQFGGAGAGGAGMMPPMMSGGGAGMMPGMQMGGGGPPMGSAGAGMMGMMGGGRMGGGGGVGAGGGRGDLSVLPIAGSRLTPRGFTVNIAAQLLYPASSYWPSYGSSDSQLGSGGGGGGSMGGMMGGMGPMMPGAMMMGRGGGGGAAMMPGAQMSGGM